MNAPWSESRRQIGNVSFTIIAVASAHFGLRKLQGFSHLLTSKLVQLPVVVRIGGPENPKVLQPGSLLAVIGVDGSSKFPIIFLGQHHSR